MNIVFIVSDTFRRDYLPCYGDESTIAPHLSKFAADGLVFEDCYPASFPTVPCRSDIMTGRYTFTYLPWGPLPQTEVTLAQTLSKHGYKTAAIADTPFLARNGYGHDRGFQEFVYIRGQLEGTERRYMHLHRQIAEEMGYCGAKTFKEAADWVGRHHQEQFFLYIDTWDPHEPWDPPAYYVAPYLPDYAGEIIAPNYWDYKEDGLSERDLEIARACYRGEISMVDYWFGFFMERLRVLNLLEDTIIIFTSDHGFYFGEHGLFGKRRFQWPDGSKFDEGFGKGLTLADQVVYRSPLHNEITQVPLIMHMPNQEGGWVPGLVSSPDLNPTILEMAGVEIPASVQAKSILPLIQAEPALVNEFVVTSAPFEEIGQLSKTVDDSERAVGEISPSTITDGEWDLLYGIEGDPVELYRTKDDPGHQNDLYEEFPEIAKSLHQRFVAWLESLGTSEGYVDSRRKIT